MRLKSLTLGLFCAVLCGAQGGNQTGIAHVAFRVADLDASRAFYSKLGFEQFYEVKQGEKVVQTFMKINDRQFIELYPRTDAAQPVGLMHLCYESDNLEAVHAEYVQHGLTVSDVRKAGMGNLLMTMKDPEGQTVEYTQYMPGSRHYDDRGKHLGEARVSQMMLGATSPAKDVAAMRKFYVEKFGFSEIDHAVPARLKMPGDSGQEVDLATAGTGIEFAVADVRQAGAVLGQRGLAVKTVGKSVSVVDPDGAVLSFVKK